MPAGEAELGVRQPDKQDVNASVTGEQHGVDDSAGQTTREKVGWQLGDHALVAQKAPE
jgi:hypothetical protein